MKWLKTETVNVRLLVPSALTVAASVGAAAGYVVASKMLEKKFRELADTEIAEAKVFYQNMYSRPTIVLERDEEPTEDVEDSPDVPTGRWDDLAPKDRMKKLTDAVEAMTSYAPPEGDPRPEPTGPSTVINIFENPQPPGEEVLDALLTDRDPTVPYIITKQEFLDNEPDHEQIPFTYYEGDNVLVRDNEEFNPIQDFDLVVGEDNLLRFGYGSADEYTLYVRNEAVNPPFDAHITRSNGKYTEEVMGIDDKGAHLKHSRSPRKFRLHDD